jgi:predicted RNA binding protein YcfA (HicA-like mRNA interferase family)
LPNLVRLVEKFINEPGKIDADDVDSLFEAFDWRIKKSSGSHRTYHKEGQYPITVPLPHSSKKIKPEYVRKVIRYLRLEEWYEQNKP